MSRCFPCSQYSSKIAGDAALIESIKLQRGMEKTEQETRKERKEKKRQRRESKRQRRESKNIASETKHDEENQFNSEKIHKGKKRVVGLNGEYLEKKREEDEVEQQREKSNLTEELGQAVNLHAPSNSADSTENSNKRRRTSSSSTANITSSTANFTPSTVNHRPGNVIRIKLKHNGSVSTVLRELPNSSSERTQLSSHMHDKELANSSGERTLTQQKLGAFNVKQTNSVTPPSVLGVAQRLPHSRHPPSIPREVQKSSARSRNLPAIPEVAQQQLNRLRNLPSIPREAQKSSAPSRNLSGEAQKALTSLPNVPAIPRAQRNLSHFRNNPSVSREAQKNLTSSLNLPSVPGEAQKNLACSSNRPIEVAQKNLSVPVKTQKQLAPSIPVESEIQRKYKQLVDSIAPLPALVVESDTDDWLFTRKQDQRRPKEERHESFDGHGRSLTSSSLGYHCAQYLPDAGVYALPYTMPL